MASQTDSRIVFVGIAAIFIFLFFGCAGCALISSLTTPQPTPTPTPLPTQAPVPTPTVQPTPTNGSGATPLPDLSNGSGVTSLPEVPEATEEPTIVATPAPPRATTAAGHPIVDPTSGHGGVVVITPTPVAVLDRTIDLEVTYERSVDLGRQTSFLVYVGTRDEPLHDILIRFNVSYMNRYHEMEGLGYFPVNSEDLFSLPAHSHTTKTYLVTLLRDGVVLSDGVKSVKYPVAALAMREIPATLYSVRVDLLSGQDSQVIGTTLLNGIEVGAVDQYGYRSFDY